MNCSRTSRSSFSETSGLRPRARGALPISCMFENLKEKDCLNQVGYLQSFIPVEGLTDMTTKAACAGRQRWSAPGPRRPRQHIACSTGTHELGGRRGYLRVPTSAPRRG
jgi:hypothetical protein